MANEDLKPAAPVDFTKTPEFAQAVAAGVASVLPDLVTKQMEAMKAELLASVPASSDPEPDVATKALLSRLAMEIGIVSDQGTQRKRVAPEEMKERMNAFERMGVYLTKAQMATDLSEKPRYRIVGQQFSGDQRIDPYQRQPNRDIIETEVWYEGIPNTSMRPINEVAENIYREFIRYLGGSESVNGIPKPVQPMWITNGGKIIVGGRGNETAAAHGLSRTPEPLTIDGGKRVGAAPATMQMVSATDPRATKIPVLGTIAPPATVGGTTAKII